MDFLGIGWGEIIVIAIVALLLWGPARIVEFSRSLGKTVRAFKRAANEFTAQLDVEIEREKKTEAAQPKKDVGGGG